MFDSKWTHIRNFHISRYEFWLKVSMAAEAQPHIHHDPLFHFVWAFRPRLSLSNTTMPYVKTSSQDLPLLLLQLILKDKLSHKLIPERPQQELR